MSTNSWKTNLYWLIGWYLMPTHLNWLIVCLVFNANKFINFALQNRKYNGQPQLRFPRTEKITLWISTFLKKFRSALINTEVLKFVRPSNRAGRKSQGPAILSSMPVRVSDKNFCLCILLCTRNWKCNWYARTITVNSELDSASNDIYFLNMQLFPW